MPIAAENQILNLDYRKRLLFDGGYRPDIDILRALAVTAVLCFHWDIAQVPGGFVGVDIFFVISGFLITQVILKDLDAGRFSFVKFYARRIRRILPALYAVMAVVCITAWFTLLPPQMTDLARSVVAVIFSSSNFLFWHEAGYFDAPTLTKPLLHTWSLSVEEQFYLAFPAFIVMLSNLRGWPANGRLVFPLVALAVVSFSVSVWLVQVAPSNAFYLGPGRAWEFLIGALLAAVRSQPRHMTVRIATLIAGAAMIVFAFISFRTTTSFPGASALLPCVGTALCIWANTGRVMGLFERQLVIVPVFYGKISYSLYLWHWPVWVFSKSWLAGAEPSASIKWGMFALVTALSFLSYRFVEQPFRNPKRFSGRALSASLAFASLAFVGFGIAAMLSNGFSMRIAPEIAALSEYSHYEYQQVYRANTCFLQPSDSIDVYKADVCAEPRLGARNVLLWGDSLAAHYLTGLKKLASERDFQLMQVTAAACPPFFSYPQSSLPNCEPLNDLVKARLKAQPPELVIISANWAVYAGALGYDRFYGYFQKSLQEVIASRVRVMVFGPSIQYTHPLPTQIALMALRGADILGPVLAPQPSLFELDEKMAADIAAFPSVAYISILKANCPDRKCPMLTRDAIPLQWDSVHLTAEGSEQVIEALRGALTKPLLQSSGTAIQLLP